MKSQNWLELPIMWTGFYPESIVKLAEKLNIPVEKIAEDKGIKPGAVAIDFIRRDDVELIYKLSQDPEEPGRTIVYYLTGEMDIVMLPAAQVVKRIDKFLGPDGYIFHKRTLIQQPFHEEAADEPTDPEEGD